jgi:glutamate-1-semialdehyde 2,1-aminomutase
MSPTKQMSIETSYQQKFAGSAALYTHAVVQFPSGVTHDARYYQPFPLYIERSNGAYKWDVDDNQMIDYWSGHGSLLLGHNHPDVVAAVQYQATRGTHFGACHPLELRWGEIVRQLVPGAEQVRFTSSGTEATMLALRLARAFTRRPAIIRFSGHFHGWHDMIAPGADSFDPNVGLSPATLEQIVILAPDLDVVEQTLRQRDDIAAVILEPSGASYGMSPLDDGFLRGLHTLTTHHNVLLVCDEVVTGFRVMPGGVQQRAGVTADLTCLAKVLAGGLPGGAVAGRTDILRHLAFGDADWNAHHKIRHQGTYNANPLSAAAGCTTLERIATGEPSAKATRLCQRLIAAMNDVLVTRKIQNWTVYGNASIFHILAGSIVPITPGGPLAGVPLAELKSGGNPHLVRMLRLALLNAGLDLMRGRSGFLTAAHSDADITTSVAAFDAALGALHAEGLV